ncbi:MAG TPA: ATP-binding cassette domain-containing protein [Ktedonobacterales bacterium]|nr:ATP-binding cassette domain-containing protein [Ktedonobacterales bacterium]
MARTQTENEPAAAMEAPPEERPPRLDVMLQTRGLTKRYGERLAVNTLNLEIVRGEVFGFLGKNGAGKTTTIRMLLNLVKPTAGEIWLFGERLNFMPGRLLARIGALIERPSFQTYLSGRDNLIAIGGYTGGVPERRVDEVLGIVGLGQHGKDRYARYSPGMRQRLGVGAALLTDPELLILDEPGDGLDPAGIVEMRELVLRLAEAGKTIFISSHMLAEFQQVYTRIGIMRGGELIAVGKVDELLRPAGRWEIEVANPETVGQMFRYLPGVRSASIEDGELVIEAPGLHGSEISRYLGERGVWPESMRRGDDDVEQNFLRLAEGEAGR